MDTNLLPQNSKKMLEKLEKIYEVNELDVIKILIKKESAKYGLIESRD